jgi:hypothetical protein
MHRAKPFCRALISALGCGLLALGLAVSAHAQCQLNSPSGKIKHVVYVEFDNVHFTRDNPNVPSDHTSSLRVGFWPSVRPWEIL